MKLFDVVRLKENLPKEGLQKGAVGTIVALFDTPEAGYEVEFANERGETVSEVALLASQVEQCQPVTQGPLK